MGSVLDALLDFKLHHFSPLSITSFKIHRDVFDFLPPYFSAEDGSASSEVMASGRVCSVLAALAPAFSLG